MLNSLEVRGADIVIVEDGVVDQLGSDLDEDIVAKVETVPGVAKVMASLLDIGSFESQGTVISVLIQGWEPNSTLFDDLQVERGASISSGRAASRHAGRSGRSQFGQGRW